MSLSPIWQLIPPVEPPDAFVTVVQQITSAECRYLPMLLWQRGIGDVEQLPGFLNPQCYQPTSPFAFGEEMNRAIDRLQQARNRGEKVAIWGDFDADGITSTAVLWDGLGQFFMRPDRLMYLIPDRLKESHGLNRRGIDDLKQQGVTLIVTCDTGSTNHDEIDFARQQGMDVIVTDHHTLPDDRPPVAAIINPRFLPPEHPLFHLSGVAVAYKLVEALYLTLPDIPQQPLSTLLDLVAIGLIADLVQLRGDCRYLAQVGIGQLQQQLTQPTRPGVAKLLELCKRNGDRPTDISFGLGPRINAVSRIQGDASFCVELLTSRDAKRCQQLATDTELANTRRQALQRDVAQQVQARLATLDLSTTSVIVLEDPQWAVGVLGLVANQVAQEYGRPAILLSSDRAEIEEVESIANRPLMARGSARSIAQIDLYQLVKSQAHFLDRFGGHPFAAGLSLPLENLPLFVEGINRQLSQVMDTRQFAPIVQADLRVTVAELGKDLFRELKYLEPCGMGNAAPKLLIENCWFTQVWHRNIQDAKGGKVRYIKTEFKVHDRSSSTGFSGMWWGHYKDEIPHLTDAIVACDAIVELDYNAYRQAYEVRLIAVRRRAEQPTELGGTCLNPARPIAVLEARTPPFDSIQFAPNTHVLTECPSSWDELHRWLNAGVQEGQSIAIAFAPPDPTPPEQIWQQLVGIAKYLSRTGTQVTLDRISHRLGMSNRVLEMGLIALEKIGFEVIYLGNLIQIQASSSALKLAIDVGAQHQILKAIAAIREEQFRRQYFAKISVSTLQSVADRGSRESF
jgi:single-stranded-DNA-specific exonuclease